jgi:hypothetical protein
VTAEEIAKAANAKKGTISNLLKNMKGLERKRMEKLYYWRRKNWKYCLGRSLASRIFILTLKELQGNLRFAHAWSAKLSLNPAGGW